MRYDDWDVILFPTGRDSKIPFKEFKVACHVVPDLELAHIHGAVGIPVMTCFVPSLAPGAGFQISIHCWRRPDLSQFARTYSKHTDLIKFEARILIDGRLVASTVLDREVNGPHLITSTCEFTKTGELERLRFPHFRRELLFQNHWRPGDDIGRIKVVISEGFPRDSLSAPIERVKNVVAFSFQHAPLDILETNAIAWPNQSMWQCSPFNPVMPVPTYQLDDGPSSHAHSPGRKSLPLRNIKSQAFPAPALGTAFAGSSLLGNPALQTPYFDCSNTGSANTASQSDPFTDAAYLEWANAMVSGQQGDLWDGLTLWPTNERSQRQSTSDTIMPDYVPPQMADPMHVSGPSLEDEPTTLKVPTNTPTGEASEDGQNTGFQMPQRATLPSDFASSLTRSLLNQPFPLPVQHRNPCFQMADSESSKDNQHIVHGLGNTDIMEAGKASQSGFVSDADDSTVPVSASSGTPSGEFGSLIASLGCSNSASSLATPSSSSQTETTSIGSEAGTVALGSSRGNKSGNVNTTTKRPRNFTPASVKAIDEEDEPRRISPHLRMAGYNAMDMLGEVGQ